MALSITPGAASAATTSDPELKVMSWNVQGGTCSSRVDPQVMANRIDAISQAHAVTVFGLQEIHIDQVQRVRDQLATTSGVPYYYKFGPTSCGDTRGNAIISRYTITDSVFQPYAAYNQAWDDNGEKRAAVGVKIAREGRRVWIFTTHLTVKGGADTGPAPVRARQAIELRNLADRYSTAPVRTIVPPATSTTVRPATRSASTTPTSRCTNTTPTRGEPGQIAREPPTRRATPHRRRVRTGGSTTSG